MLQPHQKKIISLIATSGSDPGLLIQQGDGKPEPEKKRKRK